MESSIAAGRTNTYINLVTWQKLLLIVPEKSKKKSEVHKVQAVALIR